MTVRILTPESPEVSGRSPVYVAPIGGTPEVRFRDPLHAHLQDVATVGLHVDLPDAWLAVRESWARMVSIASPCRDKLTAAVVAGQGDLDALHAQALAETSADTAAVAELHRHVSAAVHDALDRRYAPVSGQVYKRISRLFNDAAHQQDDHRLDELLQAMLAAARLCGANPDVAPHATNRLALALSVDPKRAHKRRITEAFPRWQRIRDLGAEVRANINPLAEPWQLPALVRCVDTDRRLREHDPLDGDLPRGWTGGLEGWIG